MFDVHVVGAGPAGSAAARAAAEEGAKVLLSEEHSSIGEPERCSGLVSKKGLDSFGFDYSPAILNEIRGARFHSPSAKVFEVNAGSAIAFAISRSKFDSLCAGQAEKAGAKLELGKRVSKKDLKGKRIIGADGLSSRVAEWFGFPEISGFVSCFQATYSNARIPDKKHVEIFASSKLFPGFFGWVIPLNEEQARVGIGCLPAENCRKKFEEFLKLRQVSEIISGAKLESSFAYCIPIEARKETGKKNVFLAGNAAGQVKATTGGGVFFGGACGRLAGRLAASGDSGEEYESAWRASYGRDLSIHSRIRKFLDSLDDPAIEKYFGLAKAVRAEKFLSAYGDMDRPTAMLPHLSLFPGLKLAYSTLGFAKAIPEGAQDG